MTFGLKNAVATYQRCIQNCFHDQIGRNVHAYLDDVVIKSQKTGSLIDDLKETFANLLRYDMKLNPTKCVFGVPAGKLLGFIVSERGIEANLEKNQCNTQIEEARGAKGCSENHGLYRGLEPVHCEVRRKSHTIISALHENISLCVG